MSSHAFGDNPALAEAEADAESRLLSTIDPNRVELFAAGLTAPYFARLRRDAPVHYTADSADGPFWSITRHADVHAIEADHARFSSDAKLGGVLINGTPHPAALPMFIAMDPPLHGLRRRTVAPAFASGRLQAMAAQIRAEAGRILDALPLEETFDWATLAAPDLAAMALAVLFDFPQSERRLLTRWAGIATTLPSGGGSFEESLRWNAEMRECFAAFDALWMERAAEAPRDDLISMLAHGPATRDMPLVELQGNVVLLIVGGHDTTRDTLSGGLLALSGKPHLFAELRADRARVPAMVEESIRWQTPLAHMRRTAIADVDLHGHRIARGDKVVLWYISANRDESVIADPEAFWINRPDAGRHLSFGHGIHRCLGGRFAEMALSIIWEEMLDRFAGVTVVEPPMRFASTFNNGYVRLMVRLTR